MTGVELEQLPSAGHDPAVEQRPVVVPGGLDPDLHHRSDGSTAWISATVLAKEERSSDSPSGASTATTAAVGDGERELGLADIDRNRRRLRM